MIATTLDACRGVLIDKTPRRLEGGATIDERPSSQCLDLAKPEKMQKRSKYQHQIRFNSTIFSQQCTEE